MTRRIKLEQGWSFCRLGEDGPAGEWTAVELPHSPFVGDLDGRRHWFGVCEYRRTLPTPTLAPGDRAVLHVGAAMQAAQVFADGRCVAVHDGGFLPFEVDLTEALSGRDSIELAVRVDNRWNPDIPPGKRYEELDFCWYGGLYRTVELRVRPALHLTDAISAQVPGGGGIFFRTLAASAATARLQVDVHAANTGKTAVDFLVRAELRFDDAVAATVVSPPRSLAPGAAQSLALELVVPTPRLWSPAAPALYDLVVSLVSREGRVLDQRTERCGIRRLAFSRSRGFELNGRRLRLRGTNRHQELPGVGFAVPRAAQFREARRIKDAGFDYVRLSHYPQSPDFLDACDELGLVVMNCLPGWQNFGGEKFAAACRENARQLIRRDRNHACVVLWELSLNETPMPAEFAAELHAIGHEEYPGDQMFTCGWLDRYDVFVHSRQHGHIHTWSNGDKALVVAEYGDWEFYAANDGFDQRTGAGRYDPHTNSRQLRGDGERALLRQAANHALALDDTLASPAVLDGQWAMFDYARGYDPVRAAVGVQDIFRLPKFSFHFYRSQRAPDDAVGGAPAGPVVFIASHWTAGSSPAVTVFSNCERVELFLNGRSVGEKSGRDAPLRHLPHPPLLFSLPRFEPGLLDAVGFIGGRPVARHTVETPRAPAALALRIDDLGILPAAGEPDVLFAHACLVDAHGAVCVNDTGRVSFDIEGAVLVDPAPAAFEAGIASVVIRLPATAAGFTLKANDGQRPAVAVTWHRDKNPPKPNSAARESLPAVAK